MAIQAGRNHRLIAAFQAAKGTFHATATDYFQIRHTATDLGQTAPIEENDELGLGFEPGDASLGPPVVDGQLTTSLHSTQIGLFLRLMFGAPSTIGAGPYTHVFESGNIPTEYMSFERGYEGLTPAQYEKFIDVMAGQMSIPFQRDGLATANYQLNAVTRLNPNANASVSATPKLYDGARFRGCNGGISRNGALLGNVLGGQFNYAYTLEGGGILNGQCSGDDLERVSGGASGNVRVRFGDTTLLDQALSDEVCSLEFGYDHVNGDSLSFLVHRAKISQTKAAINGPSGVDMTFDWQASNENSADPRHVTVTLINNVSAY